MIPPDLAALARSIDDLLGAATERTELLRAAAGPVARLAVALDEHDLPAALALAPDALLLHRHWRVPPDALPPGVGLLACHLPLDLRLGLASTPELHAALGVREVATIGERDGVPLLALCAPDAPLALGDLRARLRTVFGGVEAEESTGDDADPVGRVATARAMTPALVRAAAAAGATAYVTGQLRPAALASAREVGVHVLAVGHRRSERWALGALAAMLRARWPGLTAEVAAEATAP